MKTALDQFEADWLARLNKGAHTRFEHAPMTGVPGLHSAVADDFVASLGLKRIGFNWELLDASPGAPGPRSALSQLTEALASDISNPSREWLGERNAGQCARAFLDAFDPSRRTIASNRYDGLWNPISGASVEWGFVGFDDERIALLLIAEA